jgi:hypothetical protein
MTLTGMPVTLTKEQNNTTIHFMQTQTLTECNAAAINVINFEANFISNINFIGIS